MNNPRGDDPWSTLPRLQNEISRLFGNMTEDSSSTSTATWMPPVDVHEYGDRFELFVDVPGVNPNHVEMTLEEGVLTISGTRSPMSTGNSGESVQIQRIERGQGQFYRRFVLPDTADNDNVKATGKNGVLMITIPKQAKTLPRRIQIAG